MRIRGRAQKIKARASPLKSEDVKNSSPSIESKTDIGTAVVATDVGVNRNSSLAQIALRSVSVASKADVEVYFDNKIEELNCYRMKKK